MFRWNGVKKYLSVVGVLVLVFILTFASSAYAVSFTIKDGETRTTTQELEDGDTGTIKKAALSDNGCTWYIWR
jgi:hypothetical protein